MKKFIAFSAVALFLIFSIDGHSQEITKYNFLEIIVVQKANNSGKVKRIKVEEQVSLVGQNITIEAIENIEETSTLLTYMNTNDWEFVDRQSVISEENDPIWMSYIFRKKR